MGPWAVEHKHHYLRQYIEATREARRKFVAPETGPPAGAGFLDLFAGPGMAIDRTTGELHATSTLIALQHDSVPFSMVVACDLNRENAEALRSRVNFAGDRAVVRQGDSNEMVRELVACLPPHGLNLAFVDPFAISALKFSTLEALAEAPRMDLLINFPTGDVRRNFKRYTTDSSTVLDEAFGTASWRELVTSTTDVPRAPEILVEQLEHLGYTGSANRTRKVTNRRHGELYRIMLASKHRLADKIWSSLSEPSGQRLLIR